MPFSWRDQKLNLCYNDQKKITDLKGHQQNYKMWTIRDQTAHSSPVSYRDTAGK